MESENEHSPRGKFRAGSAVTPHIRAYGAWTDAVGDVVLVFSDLERILAEWIIQELSLAPPIHKRVRRMAFSEKLRWIRDAATDASAFTRELKVLSEIEKNVVGKRNIVVHNPLVFEIWTGDVTSEGHQELTVRARIDTDYPSDEYDTPQALHRLAAQIRRYTQRFSDAAQVRRNPELAEYYDDLSERLDSPE